MWLLNRHNVCEEASRLVFKEPRDSHVQALLKQNSLMMLPEHEKQKYWDRYEWDLCVPWMLVKVLALGATSGQPKDFSATKFKQLTSELTELHNEIKDFVVSPSPSLSPEKDFIMPYENGLMYMFSRLELLQIVWRLCENTKELLKKEKKKFSGVLSVTDVTACSDITKTLYERIRQLAQSFIDALKQRGVKSILAQVQWGSTGEALKGLMHDKDEQEGYVREYVESAIEALNGVLKVKLK